MENKSYPYLLVIILALVFWQWFLPGSRVANDFPLVSQSLLKEGFDFPRVWTEEGAEGLGEYVAFFLWSYPLKFLSGLLAWVGLNFAFLERFLLLIPILILGGMGMWHFGNSLRLSNQAKFFSSLFYLTNTYVILLIDGGQLLLALAYAFFPLSFLAFDKGVKGGLRDKAVAGLAVTILGFFDFRLIFVLFLLLFLQFSYQFLLKKKKRRVWVYKWFYTGVVCTLALLFLNAYWLFPLKFAPITASTHAFFTQTAFTSFANLGHAIMLLSPHWYENIFGSVTALKWEFLPITILVFMAPLLRRSNSVVGFWMVVALISIFLTKGTSEPLSNVYPWLFQNVPGFSLFRDSTKFFVLVALSYSVLLGITLEEITLRVRKFSMLFNFFIIGYLLFLLGPLLQNQMTGTFSAARFEKEYSQLSSILEDDNSFGRIFWIPSFPPLGYSIPQHPRVEAARLVQKRTFAQGTKGEYEIFNFLREAPYMGEIFDVSGISYIVYPPLDAKDDIHPDNIKYYHTFLSQLSQLPWLGRVADSPIPLWKTTNHQERFFAVPNVWWVIGSDDLYNEATKSADLKLANNALIFAEEMTGLGKRIDEIPEAKIVLNNKTILDLAASFIDSANLIFPANKLSADPDASGWWKREAKDLISWRYFLKDKYGIDNLDFDLGGGWAVGEGNLRLEVKSVKLASRSEGKVQSGNVLLARVMESSRSGILKFYQDEKEVGQIRTKVDGDTNVRWFEIGQLVGDEEIIIKSEGDINVVNALASLDKDEWGGYKNKANELQGRIAEFSEENTLTSSATVSYTKLNPTRYLVTVSNIEKSALLVFSQTFDRFWQLDEESGLPIYSLLNGFRIERDGEYTVEFKVQRYVNPGLLISLATLFSMVILLMCKGKKGKLRI